MSKSVGQFCALLAVSFCIIQIALAQVTFSKGWGPGKRAVLYDSECKANIKSLTLLIRAFMAEMKHLMACDHEATVNYLQTVEH